MFYKPPDGTSTDSKIVDPFYRKFKRAFPPRIDV